jgi:hypothetical protein
MTDVSDAVEKFRRDYRAALSAWNGADSMKIRLEFFHENPHVSERCTHAVVHELPWCFSWEWRRKPYLELNVVVARINIDFIMSFDTTADMENMLILLSAKLPRLGNKAPIRLLPYGIFRQMNEMLTI